MRGTHYGERRESGAVRGTNLNRGSREVYVDLIAPSLSRVFNKKTLLGDQLKHVIEPRASFRAVGGVADFEKLIRFDETELLSNTAEVEISGKLASLIETGANLVTKRMVGEFTEKLAAKVSGGPAKA